ncbi:hypothetical protein L1987_54863 [Smallanthus sonchifolius]|uniref:Uncharacterized protein n=1 Tax=Smallanthus sonchifolius TaxID=185202 RepID=A0ACB9E876_9ASTR|nr:hypothetical protein L1987_54863 [Smallanthus sonchifolius]
MKKGKKVPKNEDDSEEWCFVCKDGGDMIICEHKDCLKSYHPECVAFDDSSAKPKSRFICVCEQLLEFGLQETVDFNNRNTYETLYKEYWEIINNTEKLTLEELLSAKMRLKSGKNYDSDKCDDSDEYQCSDSEGNDELKPHGSTKKLKRSKPEPLEKKVKKEAKVKSNKEEFMGWGSTRVIQFLTHIGKDTTNPLSQRELENIVKRYSMEKNLLQQKNKIIECDEWLRSIFKRKTIRMNRIYDSLETHLAENQVSSDEDEEEEDELGYGSEEIDHEDKGLVVNKKKKKSNDDKTVEEKGTLAEVLYYHFAAIVPENIKLVYLKRSLVQQFLEEPEIFESKVVGSFVRVKEDPNGCFSKGSYQLMQITGVKKHLAGENDESFILQVLETDICITSLSDDDFSEEECQDLKKKVKSGILNKLELYLKRREFLLDERNKQKLLEKVPNVVPDVEDDNKDSPKSILTHTSPNAFGITSGATKQEVPASETYEMAMKLENFFGSLEKQEKLRKPSVAKSSSQLFDFSKEKSSICDITKVDVEDTESSQWYVTSPSGDKVGPVSLSVLKNWSQAQAASKSRIYKISETEEQAKSLTAVLNLAFSRK